MDIIKENKKVIIICASLILLSFIIILLVNNFKKSDDFGYIENNTYLKNYKINEAIPIAINDEKMAKKYLAEYIKYVFLDPDKAYMLIDSEQKVAKFANKKSFEEYINKISDIKMMSAEVTAYEIKIVNGYKCYDIVDKSGNQIRFKEFSIMNYSVYFR